MIALFVCLVTPPHLLTNVSSWIKNHIPWIFGVISSSSTSGWIITCQCVASIISRSRFFAKLPSVWLKKHCWLMGMLYASGGLGKMRYTFHNIICDVCIDRELWIMTYAYYMIYNHEIDRGICIVCVPSSEFGKHVTIFTVYIYIYREREMLYMYICIYIYIYILRTPQHLCCWVLRWCMLGFWTIWKCWFSKSTNMLTSMCF